MVIINGNYREFRLDNGLVVALQRTPTQTVAAKLRVNYSASHEREGEEGLAHYIEHCLVTGGSAKYDLVTADTIRGLFGFSNAYTTIGRTLFVGQMLAEDLDTWLDYVSDHVLRPRFDEDRINGERERVLREISDTKSNPSYLANQELNSLFYQGHPGGRFVLGREEVVRRATQEVLRKFHSRGYHPNNMDLIVVGKLPDNVEERVINYFGQVPSGENMRRGFPKLKPLDGKSVLIRPAPERLNVDNPQESSAEMALYYHGPSFGEEDEYAVRAMNQILGGDTNSLLFQNLGLKKGLAYHSGVLYNGNYNCGELGINMTVPATRTQEAVEAIFEEINRMKTQRAMERIVDRIKRMAKYELAKALETNEGHIGGIETKLDYGLSPKSWIEGFDRVTPERVTEVANKYLPNKEHGRYILCIRDPLKQ